MDFSLAKNVEIGERLRFQLRADSSTSSITRTSRTFDLAEQPTFGRFTSHEGARVVQMSARLRF